jgi:hypothetical protein
MCDGSEGCGAFREILEDAWMLRVGSGSMVRIMFIAFLVVGFLAPPLFAAPSGREIMERVDRRDDGDNEIRDMEMTLIDKRGRQRLRILRAFRRDQGADTQTIMFFLSPADVKETGLLIYDYDDSDKDDDQWLYLPGLKKTKRIASTDKSGSFMGSDFTYADMTDRDLDDYDYRLMKEADVNGTKVWQIEAVPRTRKEIDETGYTKSVLFVRQDNDVTIRSVHWLKKKNRLKYYDVKELSRIDGIWVPTEMHMTTKRGKSTVHKTVLKARNLRFNQELDPSQFSVRKLEAGL